MQEFWGVQRSDLPARQLQQSRLVPSQPACMRIQARTIIEGGMLAEDKADLPKVPFYLLFRTVRPVSVVILCCCACRETQIRSARSCAVVKTGVKKPDDS